MYHHHQHIYFAINRINSNEKLKLKLFVQVTEHKMAGNQKS